MSHTSGFSDNSAAGREGDAPPIPCLRCGLCCTRYQVLVYPVEARRLADHLGLSPDVFRSRYADRRWQASGSLLMRHQSAACVFLERRGKQAVCLVHSVKPQACQDWTPSLFRHDCREGLAELWGLTVGDSGELAGDEAKLGEFRAFLMTLEA